jgi:hypothetical protein
MKGQSQRDQAARTYWLEVTSGDLHGPRVEGPDFESVDAALDYLRRLCEQIDPRKLRQLLWADIAVFQVVAEGPDSAWERVWFGVRDDRRQVLIPNAARPPS